MKKRARFAVVLLALMLAMTMASCGASGGEGAANQVQSSAAAMAPEMQEDALQENPDIESKELADGGVSSTAPKNNRKLIRTVNLDVETKEFDVLSSDISAKITSTGGYIERSEQRGSSYNQHDTRSAYIVARIPKEKVDEFLNMVDTKGNIVSRQESVEDVTLQYVDIASHKKSLLVEQERLLALLEKAEKLEDIITLEERLSNVRYQLESFESQLRTFDNQVDYSTVTMNIIEVEHITEPIVKKTVWNRMTSGLEKSIYDIGAAAQNLAVWFVVNLPYLLIWFLIVGLLVLVIIKASTPKKKAPTAAQQWHVPTSVEVKPAEQKPTNDSKKVQNKDQQK